MAVCVALPVVLVVIAITPEPPQEPPVISQELQGLQTEQAALVLPSKPVPATVEELKKEARSVTERLLSRFPQSPEAHHILALLQKSLRQTDDAKEHWADCLALSPNHTGARVGLALVQMDQGDDRMATETLEEAILLGCASPEIYTTLATALIRLSNFDRAVEVLQKGLTVFPESFKSWLLLGQAQIQQNDLAQAETSLKKAIELSPDYTDAYYALASVCARRGDRAGGIAHRKRFAELKTQDRQMEDRLALVLDLDMTRQRTAATLCGVSTVWLHEGESAEANRLLLRAAAIAPGLPESYRILASLYQGQGRIAEAMTAQRRLVHLEPQNVVNCVNLANLSLRNGDVALAEEILEEAVRTHPDAAVAYSCLAQLSMKTGKPEQARSHAQKWIRLEPTPAGYMLLASACEQLNDSAGSESALREMRKLKKTAPRQPSAGPGQVNPH